MTCTAAPQHTGARRQPPASPASGSRCRQVAHAPVTRPDMTPVPLQNDVTGLTSWFRSRGLSRAGHQRANGPVRELVAAGRLPCSAPAPAPAPGSAPPTWLATFPEYAHLFSSAIDWTAGNGGGRNVLTVEIAEDYPARVLECAKTTTRELAAADGLDLGAAGELYATASTPGFGAALAERLGIPAARAAFLPDNLGRAHTAGRAAALESVPLANAGTALLVCAGAGITVGAAVYRR
jgi:hypothetical protein